MWRRLTIVGVILCLPQLALAQVPAEKLMPSGSQIYVRWDGRNVQRDAFNATAWGKTLQGDTGKFFTALWDYLKTSLQAASVQAPPELMPLFREVPMTLAGVVENGVVMGIEVKSAMPPDAQAVIVFPKGAGANTSLLPMLRRAIESGKIQTKETRLVRRTVTEPADPLPVQVGWWAEGDDVVITIGTHPAVDIAKNADTSEGIEKNPLYQKIKGFKEFPTNGRGFVDVASLLKVGGGVNPIAAQIIEELGVKGIESMTMQSGYDGPAIRSIMETHMVGQRKGLVALGSKKMISIKDLPPLPDDVTSFSASNFNPANLYEGLIQIGEAVMKGINPQQPTNVRETVQEIEKTLGLQIGNDLFASLDDLSVSYSSSSEGPLGLGTAYLVKVKDEAKLRKTLEGIADAAKFIPLISVRLNKKQYRDVEFSELIVAAPGAPEVPALTYAIQNGWFAMSSYPQPIKGFILRNKGELPSWKADEKLTKALTAFPKEFMSISVSDPRPGMQMLLSVAPMALNLGNTLTSQFMLNIRPFDVSLVPHSQEAVRLLFPSITITTDDGQTIRADTRASMSLPF